jgi:hypothetical protein
MAFLGMPGPFEMLIILAILALLGLPLIILFVGLSSAERKRAAPHAGPTCPKCGGWTVPQASFCQWCGNTLGAAPGISPFKEAGSPGPRN